MNWIEHREIQKSCTSAKQRDETKSQFMSAPRRIKTPKPPPHVCLTRTSDPDMGKGVLRVLNLPWDEKSKIYTR